MKLFKYSKDKNFLLNFSTVSIWTLVSRFFGFIRDVLMAYFLGASIIAEAFIIAFSIPNLFRRIFAEGAFTSAFLPMLSKRIKNRKKFLEFSSETFSILFFILTLLIIIAEVIMPILIVSTAGGFLENEKFDISVYYARLMFPYIFFISLTTFFGSILNTINKFSLTSSLPVILNIFLIFSMILAEFLKKDIGIFIVFSVPLAGILQLIIVWYAIKVNNFKITLSFPKVTKDVKFLVKTAIPTALAAGVIQINLLAGRQIASFFDGAIAWLTYADRLYQLPLGVIGIAMGTVLLPNLSKKISQSKIIEAKELITKSLSISFLFSIPSTVALILIPYKIIEILFERGQFSSIDTIATGNALWIYATGLPAFILQKIISTIFFAESNTKTPFKCALVSMFLNILISILLIPYFGYLSPAIGISISAWIMCFLLIKSLKNIKIEAGKDFKIKLMKITLSSIVMGSFIISSEIISSNYFEEKELFKILYFIIQIVISILIYFVSLRFLGFFKK